MERKLILMDTARRNVYNIHFARSSVASINAVLFALTGQDPDFKTVPVDWKSLFIRTVPFTENGVTKTHWEGVHAAQYLNDKDVESLVERWREPGDEAYYTLLSQEADTLLKFKSDQLN